jgi:hypothetical protein
MTPGRRRYTDGELMPILVAERESLASAVRERTMDPQASLSAAFVGVPSLEPDGPSI